MAHCRELLHANQVHDAGEDYGMNFKLFPHMLFMTDKVFDLKIDLKKFLPRAGYRCRNVTIGHGVAATIDSYSHLHTEYVLTQGLRKNELNGSWDVVTLQFVDMSYSPVAPNCAIPPILKASDMHLQLQCID